jgi:P27 family predicted phage terminase small subunit
MPGRRPKPTALKLLSGNPGHRPLNQAEPQPARVLPQPPNFLGPAARAKWNEMAPELHRIGLLTAVDGDALAIYCTLWARLAEAEAILEREGLVIEGEKGRGAHPAAAIARDCRTQLRAFAVEFGLTPAARSRLSIKPEKSSDDLEVQLFGESSGKNAHVQ